MLTYKDFNSREEFVRYLNLWHYDKNSKESGFVLLTNANGFEHELQKIKNNLDVVKHEWHDQSIDHIEKSVSAKGQRQIDIMQGQKNDKLQAGYRPDQSMYRVKQANTDSVLYDLAQTLGLESAYVRYHVQFPGEVTVFHTDIFSPSHEFLPQYAQDDSDQAVGKDTGTRRIIVALEDWDWGHVFQFGCSNWTHWRAGDVVYWEYGVPHCTANMGYVPRISASITGYATSKFNQKLAHAKQR